MRHKQQSFLGGAAILMASMLLVKVVGMFFKVPLTAILGGEGMGYFMTAYSIFNPVFALSTAGLPSAVSRMVSTAVARGRHREVVRTLRVALEIYIALGALLSVGLFLLAELLCARVNTPAAVAAVRMIAPSIFFGAITSAFRGYFEGLRDMRPTAFSQVLEALIKLGLGIALAAAVMSRGQQLGTPHAELLPLAAAAAIAGVMLGTVGASAYSIGRFFIVRGGVYAADLARSAPPAPDKTLAKRLVRLAVPACMGALVVNLSSLVDLFTVMNRLELAVTADLAAVAALYGSAELAALSAERIPNLLYGAYSGLALTIYNLVPAITLSLGTSALPMVTGQWARRDRPALRASIESVLRMSCIVAFPMGLGIAALPGPILSLIYFKNPFEVALATPLLRVLGLGALFAALTVPINSMLQAIGRIYRPVQLMSLGAVLKLALNYLLVSVPGVNALGAALSTSLCYALIFVGGLWSLLRATDMRLSLFSVLGKPLFCAALCGAAAWAGYGLLSRVLSPRFSTLAAVALGALVYLLALALSRTLKKSDFEAAGGLEKLRKALEKYGCLG